MEEVENESWSRLAATHGDPNVLRAEIERLRAYVAQLEKQATAAPPLPPPSPSPWPDRRRETTPVISRTLSAEAMAEKRNERLLQEIGHMDGSVGFDAVIICTSNKPQEDYWQARLTASRGDACKKDTIVLAVNEDWNTDGAGNGLGTLYAYKKACAKALEQGTDLGKVLASGGSVAIYHTAGKGTRLAPLPGAENNNKPGVKLPSLVSVDGKIEPLTILEAVIRQTGCYAPLRSGRVSVFWGDQVFIPSAGHQASGSHHIDILAQLGPMPSAEEWEKRGMNKYGLIPVNETGDASQVEKVTHADAMELLTGFGAISQVGPSLGSFSVTLDMMSVLQAEFADELAEKTAAMDTDPHFWMPMTLSKVNYVAVMTKKGETTPDPAEHWERMTKVVAAIKVQAPDKRLFGAIDVGSDGYWWDYGQLRLYVKNNMMMTDDSVEAAAYRKFFKVSNQNKVTANANLKIMGNSVVLNSSISKGSVKKSLVNGVHTGEINVENSILMNVTARSVRGSGCVLYNVVYDGDLILADGQVYTNVFVPGQPTLVQRSTTSTDGKTLWKLQITGNDMSFNDLYRLGRNTNVVECYALAKRAHEELQQSAGL